MCLFGKHDDVKDKATHTARERTMMMEMVCREASGAAAREGKCRPLYTLYYGTLCTAVVRVFIHSVGTVEHREVTPHGGNRE